MTPFYVGIDVSKGYADFMIINAQKQPVVQGFQLDDTFEGHYLEPVFSRSPESGIICCNGEHRRI